MENEGDNVDPDRTANLMPGQVWKPDTKKGSFLAFFESCSMLPEAEFLARFPHPVLLSNNVGTDRATWDKAVVLPVSKAMLGDANEIVVGRDLMCDVVIAHSSVSRRHVAFVKEGDAWFVMDLGAKNGTKLNDTVLEPQVRSKLPRDMAMIDLGGVRLAFNTPRSLFAFIIQIQKLEKREGPRNTSRIMHVHSDIEPEKPEKPEWNASPTAKTDTDLVPIPGALSKTSSGRTTKPLPHAKPGEVTWLKKQVFSVIGTPRRIAWTVGIIVVVIVSAWIYGEKLAFMIFGESHPEWFRR